MNFFYYLKNFFRNLINKFLEFFDLKIARINPKIIEQSKIEKEIIKISRKYSVTSEYSMHALVQAIKYSKNIKTNVIMEKIPGMIPKLANALRITKKLNILIIGAL